MPIKDQFSFIKMYLWKTGIAAFCLYSLPCQSNESEQASTAIIKILDFDTAVRRTLNQSLTLYQAQSEIQSKKGLVTQARLYPNPEASYYLETSEKGWKQREDFYTISQLVEFGGKRQKIMKIASYEYYAALIDYDKSKLEQLNQLSKAFIRVAAAQELLQLAFMHQNNAREALRLINAKAETGKASVIQQHKAQTAQTYAHLNVRKATAEFNAAKNHLALSWASSSPDFEIVEYPLFDIEKPPALEDYLLKLCNQPEIVQSLYKYMAAYYGLRLEKAAKIPDVVVTVGYSYDQGDKGIVAGVSLPLPIWNRNQGNIQRAYYDMLKTGDKGKQLWLFLENKLSQAYFDLMRCYQEIEDLKHLVLKASHEVFILAQEGYREGKLDYWEVLDAQTFFFETREKYISALVQYHNKRADIDYLTSQTN